MLRWRAVRVRQRAIHPAAHSPASATPVRQSNSGWRALPRAGTDRSARKRAHRASACCRRREQALHKRVTWSAGGRAAAGVRAHHPTRGREAAGPQAPAAARSRGAGAGGRARGTRRTTAPARGGSSAAAATGEAAAAAVCRARGSSPRRCLPGSRWTLMRSKPPPTMWRAWVVAPPGSPRAQISGPPCPRPTCRATRCEQQRLGGWAVHGRVG